MGEEKKKGSGGAPMLSSYNIHQRIHRIMSALDYIKKDKDIKDKGGRKMYSVTGHDNVTRVIHPLLVKYRVNLIPTGEEMVQEGNRTRICVTFRWVNIDKPEDFIEQKWYGYGIDHSDKGPGKAISYAQRYIVLKTLHLETGDRDLEEDDTDFNPEDEHSQGETTKPSPKQQKPTGNHPDYDKQLGEKITPDLLNEIYEIGYGMKWQAPAIMAFVQKNFGGKNPPTLTCDEGLQCIDTLKEYGKTSANENDIPLG